MFALYESGRSFNTSCPNPTLLKFPFFNLEYNLSSFGSMFGWGDFGPLAYVPSKQNSL